MNAVAKIDTRQHSLSSIEEALKSLDRIESEIRNPETFQRLLVAQASAEVIRRAFSDVKVVRDRAGELDIAANVILATKLVEVGKAKGTIRRGAELAPRDDTPCLTHLMPDTTPDKAKKRSAKAHQLAKIPEQKRVEIIQKLKDEDKPITPATVIQASKRDENEQKRQEIKARAPAFSNDGPFDVVVMDPPWQVQKIEREVRPNQSQFDYPTMTIAEITKFWKDDIAPRLNDDCHVFVWTTQKYLPDTFKILSDVGLKYVLTMVWHKSGGFQPIGLPQYNCEFIVYARKGAPIFVDTKNFNCCFEAPRREHSRKPDEFYEVIARVTGGARIEVFARERREGFWQFGNEIDRFAGVNNG